MSSKIKLNINSDDHNVNDNLYCWSEFGERPNKVAFYNYYDGNKFEEIISSYSKGENTFSEFIPSGDGYAINKKSLIKIDDELYLSYLCIDNSGDPDINEIAFYSKGDKTGLMKQLIQELSPALLVEESEEDGEPSNNLSKFNTFAMTQEGLILENFEMDLDEDQEFYYNKETYKSLKSVTKKIKKSKKGLTLLTGERGTGKTSSLKYITEKTGKSLFFIPNNMLDYTLGSPEFKTFLNNHPNILLVIDDCETLMGEGLSNMNLLSNSILQIVDGVLSDKFRTNVLLVFNDKPSGVDLMDCNNLIGEVSFKKLELDEVKELTEHIGSKKKFKNKNKLSNILKGIDNNKSNIGL